MKFNRDDAIVVVMGEELDRAQAYQEARDRLRRIVAELPHYEMPEDAPADDRRRYWKLREVAARLSLENARSRRERAETEYQLATAGPVLVREQPEGPGAPSRLDREFAAINRRLDGIEATLKTLATRVELESLRDDIRIAVEGFGELQASLKRIEERLEALDARVTQLDLRVTSLDHRLAGVERRLTAVEDRLTAVEHRLAAVEDRLAAIEGRLAAVEDRVMALEDRVGALEGRTTVLEGRVTALEARPGGSPPPAA